MRNAPGTIVARARLNPKSLLTAWCVVVLLCALAEAQQPAQANSAEDGVQLPFILDQMQKVQSEPRSPIPYQVIREYRLSGEKASEAGSEVVAEIDSISPEEKSFVIQKRVGSGRAEEVVRKILQHETNASTPKQQSESAINSQNYFITYLGASTLNGSSCYLLGLEPRRKDTELVRGKVWVDAHSFQIRHIEGELAKNPSWMLKKVTLKVDFADVRGVWLQTGMEAVADVRFIGTQTLRSQTVDTRVGDLVAHNMPINKRDKNAKRKARNIPAVAIAPVDGSQ
jgi:hypothetical protein